MVAASMGKGKILGLEPPAKSEVGRPGDFSTAKGTRDMAKSELVALGVADPREDQVTMAVEAMRGYAASLEAIATTTVHDVSLTEANQLPAARRH
jgi:hypothetical protein